MSTHRVVTITAVAAGPCAFELEPDTPGGRSVLSSSRLVQALLVHACLTGAEVELDLVPGSAVIQRVHPFEAGNGLDVFPSNAYHVSRLATQRAPDGRDERLEAFLVRNGGPEKAYNVYDQALQQLLQAAFAHVAPGKGLSLHCEFAGDDIVLVRLGGRPGAPG
jgi:hypothetical protein